VVDGIAHHAAWVASSLLFVSILMTSLTAAFRKNAIFSEQAR
jgi:hypothetical protein